MGWTKRVVVMLILTRKVDQKIVIGDDVIITILGVKGNQVRIGIEAPREVPVHREEIYQRILAERLNGASHADRTSDTDTTLPGSTM